MTTTISPDHDVMTLINVFTVDPSLCDELVKVLVDATHETMRHLAGFVSANIHRSHDDRRVVNYAQWASLEAFTAMRAHPKVEPHMARAAALAEGFDPMTHRPGQHPIDIGLESSGAMHADASGRPAFGVVACGEPPRVPVGDVRVRCWLAERPRRTVAPAAAIELKRAQVDFRSCSARIRARS